MRGAKPIACITLSVSRILLSPPFERLAFGGDFQAWLLRTTGLGYDQRNAVVVGLAPAGVELSTPRDPELRGSHITVDHPAFREMTAALWEQDVIPDFRAPHGIRIGLSPLSTSFAELYRGMAAIRERLA